MGHDPSGVELPARPVQPGQRGDALRPGLHRRLSLLRRQPARIDARPQDAAPRREHRRRALHRRLVPGSDRFNGAFQAGQGITDQLQDGNAFKISPRFGFVYDISGKRHHHRPRRRRGLLRPAAGQHGVRHDRQRPRRAELRAAVGPAPGPRRPTSRRSRTRRSSLNPTVYDFKPPKVYSWNVGVQHKLWRTLIFDLAYVGSTSKDLLRQSQINAVPLGATFLPQNQDPTRAPSATPGATALPTTCCGPTRATAASACGTTAAYSNYHSLQAALNRRFDNGFMFSAFYVWSKALTIEQRRLQPRACPNASERRRSSGVDYSYARYDRPHNFVLNFVYQTPEGRERRARRPGQRLAALGHLPLDERPAVRGRLLDPRHRQHEPHRHPQPGARIVRHLRPGHAARAAIPTSRSTPRASPRRSRAATATSRPGSSCTGPPTNNLDLSLSKIFPVGKR